MTKILDPDIRKWYYYPIVMPVDSLGHGPADIHSRAGPHRAVKLTWEVWNQDLESLSSHDFLPDAINEAMRLELERLNGKDPT